MSGQPSLSKSAAATPRPKRAPGLRMPARSDRSVNVPSPLLWWRTLCARQATRPALHRQALPLAGRVFPGFGSLGQIQVNVVGHEQIEPPIAIVVYERTTGPVSHSGDGQVRFGGGVGELSVAQVFVKAVIAVVGHQQIGLAVVVIVAHADALRPAFDGEAGFAPHLPELPMAVVVIKLQSARRA